MDQVVGQYIPYGSRPILCLSREACKPDEGFKTAHSPIALIPLRDIQYRSGVVPDATTHGDPPSRRINPQGLARISHEPESGKGEKR